MKPKAIVDPHPRTLELLFNPRDLMRLKLLLSMTVWEGSRMPAELVDEHLSNASVIIGQTDLPHERLARARKLKAIINVEGNFQPNVDYDSCFERGIHVLGVGVAFGKAVAEMALAWPSPSPAGFRRRIGRFVKVRKCTAASPTRVLS